MSARISFRVPLLALVVALSAAPLAASFHRMQIEQVVGGLCGSTRHQAIQLRQRSLGQNLVQFARIRAWDAAGANPVVVVDFGSMVANGAIGDRILVLSADWAADTGFTPDFVLSQRIPESYLAAGRLTFEADDGVVYWSFAWGAAGYTGATTGVTENDADGEFGSPWGQALPWETSQAAYFAGGAAAASANNAADYMLTAGAAIFTNNADAHLLSELLGCIFVDGFGTGDLSRWSDEVP